MNIILNNCELCNSEKEERQFALWLPYRGKTGILIDCEEFSHIEPLIRKDSTAQEIDLKVVDDNKESVIAYGVAMPCKSDSELNLEKELIAYKNYGFSTLIDSTEFVSVYEDINVYPQETVYTNNIPIACLIYTDIDLKNPKNEYGFGYTFFQKFENMNTFKNILNRKFLICLNGIEETFQSSDKQNWKNYINKERLIQISRGII